MVGNAGRREFLAGSPAVDAVRTVAHVARFLELECERAGVTMTQYRLLSYIGSAEHRAGQLADRAALSRPAVTVALDGLEQRGLVTRERVPEDRRAVALRLTRQGQKVLSEADRALTAFVSDLLEDGERDEVFRALVTLGEGMARFYERESSPRPDPVPAAVVSRGRTTGRA